MGLSAQEIRRKVLLKQFQSSSMELRCIIAIKAQSTVKGMIIVFVSALAAGFMMTLVAEEKTFKCCNKWKMSSDCQFQVMKWWFIFKETAFRCHVFPEFAALRKKCQVPVITDKSEMRICPRKLKQFRRNLNTTVDCSDPLGSQKKFTFSEGQQEGI